MLGLGWSEMLVVAVVVLIVVGPKDLPVMLRSLGRMMGSVRRISNDFRREIDKAIAVDEFKDAKKAISDPLNQTTADITREFNTIRNGKVEPSGKIKPGEEGKESVYDEIRAQAGIEGGKAAGPSAASAALRAKVSEEQARAKAAQEATKASAESKAATAKKSAPASGEKVKAAKRTPAKSATAKSAGAKRASVKAGAEPASKAAAEPKAEKAPAKRATAAKSGTAKTGAAKSGTAKPAASSGSKAAGKTKAGEAKP